MNVVSKSYKLVTKIELRLISIAGINQQSRHIAQV